ncbi:hypothetical protein [Aquimarina algiphila]|uniref:Uncharacterized protein n=1 Tax=Aquimarina algiphila TaxID=2047982 RepID=A0A554VNR1_9FLAO|nr:hypothetical protein [Aquimarina algiphila]TSE10004.1 hypothetical protein FOF46_06800 [Aquimarina algiphila]
MKTKIQLIETTITKAKDIVHISEDFDIGYRYLEGVAVLSSIGKGHLFRSFTIAGAELFPKNFEVEFLQSSTHVSPNERFFSVREIADGKKVEIDYIDGGNAIQYPYSFKLYMYLTDGNS